METMNVTNLTRFIARPRQKSKAIECITQIFDQTKSSDSKKIGKIKKAKFSIIESTVLNVGTEGGM